MDYIIWLVATVIFALLEMCTVNLVTIWFALGALVTFKVSFFTDSYMIEMWVFIITTIISLIITKPLVKNKLDKKTPTNTDSLIGETAIVTEDIKKENFAGVVKVKGKEWSAISQDKEDIKKGSFVEIVAIDGVKLVVKNTEKGE